MTKKDGGAAYSLDGVKKCLDNAFRLFKDAFNTSNPTKAALIELGIEELAKGFISLAKIPNPNADPLLDKFINLIADEDFASFLNSLKKYDLKKFNIRYHETKLQAIQYIFTNVAALYVRLEKRLDFLQEVLEPAWGLLGNAEKSDVNDLISRLSTINFRKLDEVKEKGFYVNIEGNRYISPEEQNLQSDELVGIFFILYSSLKSYVQIYAGDSFEKIIADPKRFLGGFYEYLPENVKKMLKGDGE